MEKEIRINQNPLKTRKYREKQLINTFNIEKYLKIKKIY